MIIGAHAILHSRNAEQDRAFFRDVLQFPNVDVGDGWLIFGLPPSEVAVHPGYANKNEFYLMCADVEAFVAAMTAAGVRCSARKNQGWGVLTEVTLPSGAKLGVYQPRHARPPEAAKPRKAAARKAKRPTKKKAVRQVKAAARPAKKLVAKRKAAKR